MPLLQLQNVSIQYGGPNLLDGITVQVEPGERVALVGRNGEGKSTLMRILAGLERPDSGERIVQTGVRVGVLPQTVPRDVPGTVADVVKEGLAVHAEEWDAVQRVNAVASRMGLDLSAPFASLSGGSKRRALLAKALVAEPDVLLLDEPTNHLDIESIQWLEGFLARFPGAILFVTHDRAFLRKLATRIVELDRGKVSSWSHPYDRYLELRQQELEAEEKRNALFDKKLAQEETWIRQGVKARRTRAEGRVRALMAMRKERSQRRERVGQVSMQIQQGDLSGRKVIVAEGVGYAWEGVPVVRDLTTTILRGDKIGVIGPNGCGKTTLLRLLLGQLAPQTGRVEHGTNLQVAYFDQHRELLKEDKSVAFNVCGENDQVTIGGRKRHIISYLEDFLFAPDRSRQLVKALSGGERNRLLLAKLFKEPSNVLVLDEPTNDLDAQTLELLEDLLVEYEGTVLVVSHDREFLNNVVSGTLVFEGGGVVREYVGGYDDWLSQRRVPREADEQPPAQAVEPRVERPKGRKLTNRQREDLEKLPARIEALEKELADLERVIHEPDFYKRPADEVKASLDRVARIPAEIDEAMTRWAELDDLSESS